MINRKLSGALLMAATFALLLSVHATGCSSSSGTTADGGGQDGTADTTFTTDGGHDATGEAASDAAKCNTGQTLCNGTCTDTTSDPKNCGVCGATCGSGLVCAMSTCALSCGDASGLTQCGSGCYDLTTDSDNCGSCGHMCPGGQVCSNSACGTACGAGSTLCNGACVDTSTDNANCGKCGTACTAGTVCGGGTCSITCLNGYTQCGGDAGAGFCTDTQTDNLNCGSCGNACPGGEVCSLGKCATSCGAGLVDCSGKCVDPTSDNGYCGATAGCGVGDAGSPGTVCPSGTACSNSSCQVSCPSNEVNCAGVCYDPKSSNPHCGVGPGCVGGQACSGGTVCSNGSCLSSCAANLVLCNGSCVDPTSNVDFCGASGNCSGVNAGTACQPGQVCAAGQCQVTCSPGLVACAGTCIDPTTNNIFCGAKLDCQGFNSGETCQAGYVCSAGTCTLTCQAGEINCNNTCVDPLTSLSFCGATGTCSVVSATPVTNWEGLACPTGQVCSAGACGTSCLATEALCGGACINPLTDTGYCGAAIQTTSGPDIGTGTPNTTCNDSMSGPGHTQYEGVNCTTIGGEQCVNGSCACPATTEGPATQQVVCNGNCIDPNTSTQYCGVNSACGGGQNCSSFLAGSICSGGACACPAGQIPCDLTPGSDGTATCIDPNSNTQYCGATGTTTAGCGADGVSTSSGFPTNGTIGRNCTSYIAGSACSGGACLCPSGQIPCDLTPSSDGTATCIDPNTNNQYCGATGGTGAGCGADGVSTTAGFPTDGVPGRNCVSYIAGSACSGGTCECPTGQIPCDLNPGHDNTATCIDPTSNNMFCNASGGVGGGCGADGVSTTPGFPTGSIGENCTNSLAGSACVGSSCACPMNPSGTAQEIACNGSCIDPKTSNTNCGAAEPTGPGTGLCNVAPIGFPPTNTTDPNYQGETCTGVDTCVHGSCSPACAAGQSPCPPSGQATYCANLTSDNANCGTCSNACTGGFSCSPTGGNPPGACGPSCISPDIVCPGASPPATSYCANTASDNSNCGVGAAGCGHACAAGTFCQSGVCAGAGTLVFTTCGATGASGPSQAACNTAYTGTGLAGAVTVTGSGIQQWTAPITGTYIIEAIGAQGAAGNASYVGGLGADMTGTFSLTQGQVLTLLVGQMGVGQSSNISGGGGGGTYVVSSGTPMVIAGGGGGTWGSFGGNGASASLTGTGGSGTGSVSTCVGGTSGGGGGPASCYTYAGCGGGFIAGGDGVASTDGLGGGGLSFLDGATGGNTTPSFAGGFGGGGGGGGTSISAGGGAGGGGYGGGGAGDQAGGGGSFNNGMSPSNVVSATGGDGKIIITVP